MLHKRLSVFLAALLALCGGFIGVNSVCGQQEDPTKSGVNWDDEAKKLIPEIVKANFDFSMTTMFVRKAQCKIDVSYKHSSTPIVLTGTMSYAWEDLNNNGFLTANEIELETDYVSAPGLDILMEDIKKRLEYEISQPILLLTFKQNNVKTAKIEGGHKLRLSPFAEVAVKKGFGATEAYRVMYLTVSEDLRVKELRAKTVGGGESNATLRHEKFNGLWYPSGWIERTSNADGSAVEEERTDTYAEVDGVPFPKRVVVDNSMMILGQGFTQHLELAFRDWKIEKRKEPLVKPTPDAPDRDEDLFRENPDEAEEKKKKEGDVPGGHAEEMD
ncbi:MAG: hypothetical protein RDV41_03330 [Planctomycetota bacterium]|nr:hypothetical protein [Planctomycetota bacterium]